MLLSCQRIVVSKLFFLILELSIVGLRKILWPTQSYEMQQITSVAATQSIESGLADGFLDKKRSLAMIQPFHHQYNLFSISWLWFLIHNLKSGESQCLDKKMLVDHLAWIAGIFCFIQAKNLIILLIGRFKKATQCFEESEDLWLAQYIRKYFKISTKSTEALEVHKSCFLVGVVGVIWHHRFVYTPKNFNYIIIFQNFHQLQNLIL